MHVDPEAAAEVLGVSPVPDRLARAHYRAMSELSARPELAGGHVEDWWPWWVRRYLEEAGLPSDEESVESFRRARVPWRRAVEGGREAVLVLRRLGLRVAVISNSDGGVRESLVAAGYDGLFEFVIDSSEEGVAKPDPAIFRLALDRMGLSPAEVWYVGDSLFHDVGGAQAAGLARVVLVDPLGLAPDGQPRISSVAELPDLLSAK